MELVFATLKVMFFAVWSVLKWVAVPFLVIMVVAIVLGFAEGFITGKK